MAEVIGWEAIERQYNLYKDCPYYALFDAKKNSTEAGSMIFPYKNGDKKEGWTVLKENLQAAEQNTPEAAYVIQFYEELPKSGKLDKSTPASGYFKFRIQAYQGYTPAISGVGAAAPATRDFNDFLRFELESERAKTRELMEEREELKDEIQELEEQLADKPAKEIGGIMGQVGEIGTQYPWMADMIKDCFTVLKHKFAPGAGQQQHSPGAARMAGVATDAPPDKKVNAAIGTLVGWYIQEYGAGATEEEKKRAGFEKFADDMQLLAGLTADTDMMHLALKKLRAAAA